MPVEGQVLARAVRQAQYRQNRALDGGLARIGTTPAQWDALRAISRSPGASGRALAAETYQSEQAFGTLAGRLVAQNLIDRHRGRGRSIEHHLTPAGEKVLADGHAVVDDVLAELFSPLSDRDRETLLDLLLRVGRTE
ncbi:MarR family winged helix-turn-helix transcriptional regulator [Actinomadura chokoriensis]|uniref:MarR family winged helix-turn-helix transcriptional regulator n=1 Tax=Actinomadura chokoriensis TaxID=454156 RepID=A0ABV4QVW3_9ACTN